jgi:WhiB family redox-sensing transcriptional regulator
MSRWPAASRTELAAPIRLDTDQAACRTEVLAGNAEHDWWFAEGAGETILQRMAVGICRTCPIREACGESAIASKIPYGIFGGMTPKQRTAAVRERARRAA